VAARRANRRNCHNAKKLSVKIVSDVFCRIGWDNKSPVKKLDNNYEEDFTTDQIISYLIKKIKTNFKEDKYISQL
jgi:hypothetical protein